jgi:hypothetical protein
MVGVGNQQQNKQSRGAHFSWHSVASPSLPRRRCRRHGIYSADVTAQGSGVGGTRSSRGWGGQEMHTKSPQRCVPVSKGETATHERAALRVLGIMQGGYRVADGRRGQDKKGCGPCRKASLAGRQRSQQACPGFPGAVWSNERPPGGCSPKGCEANAAGVVEAGQRWCSVVTCSLMNTSGMQCDAAVVWAMRSPSASAGGPHLGVPGTQSKVHFVGHACRCIHLLSLIVCSKKGNQAGRARRRFKTRKDAKCASQQRGKQTTGALPYATSHMVNAKGSCPRHLAAYAP